MLRLLRQFDERDATRWLERRSRLDVLSLSLLALIPLVAIDLKLGPHVSLNLLELAPVFLIACYGGRTVAYTYSAIAGFCWFVDSLPILPLNAGATIFIWACASRIGTYLLMAELSSRMRDLLHKHESQARTDGLTGLSNHRDLRLQAERLIAVAAREKSPLSAAFIDCDNFKQVNDQLGHAAGDEVLRAVARVLSSCTRPSDVAARVGGDEFVLLLPATDRTGGRIAVARLQAELASAMESLGRRVTFSIGAATFDEPPRTVDDLLARIDECQYRAKNAGKDRFVYHAAEKLAA